MAEQINILGYKVFSGKLKEIPLDQNILINTFSPNSYGLATKDQLFAEALRNSDVLVLDGVGIALGSILLFGKNIKKLAGQDCFDYFINQANALKMRVFFLGSSNETLGKIKSRIETEFQKVIVSVYAPPFRSKFTTLENDAMVKAINDFGPDILFVGMTAPKQEKWAYEFHKSLAAKLIVTIGNVFDWYAGNSVRPKKIWISLRLEWLIRIFLRPEIFRRNIGNQLIFLRDLFLILFKLKKTHG